MVAGELEYPCTHGARAQDRARDLQAAAVSRTRRPALVASFGGSDKAPDWYLNLVANPEVTVERRWARGGYRARTLAPEERQEMWPRLVALYPAYEDYQRRTSRTIQLVELAPV